MDYVKFDWCGDVHVAVRRDRRQGKGLQSHLHSHDQFDASSTVAPGSVAADLFAERSGDVCQRGVRARTTTITGEHE